MYDPLSDIHQYAKYLTIAQVVKFFEKKVIGVTRPMIQNYIRDGLLPAPVNKRFYSHKHLAALVIIDYVKTVLPIDEVKAALQPFMDDEGLSLETYAWLISALNEVSARWRETVAPVIFNNETPTIKSALLLAAHAADMRALSREMGT